MTTDEIINQCLKAIGEEDPANPVEMTRADVLQLINIFYQNEIGKRLKTLAVYTYDGSDSAHTITDGVGTLPPDFLAPHRVYDGEPHDKNALEQIFDIEDKVADTNKTIRFMLPDLAEIWIFGKTPSNTIKLYYYKKPVALTDSSASAPTALKEDYHVDPFVFHIKEIYATRCGDIADLFDLKILKLDVLDAIKIAHTAEKRGNPRRSIKRVG